MPDSPHTLASMLMRGNALALKNTCRNAPRTSVEKHLSWSSDIYPAARWVPGQRNQLLVHDRRRIGCESPTPHRGHGLNAEPEVRKLMGALHLGEGVILDTAVGEEDQHRVSMRKMRKCLLIYSHPILPYIYIHSITKKF
jgi:hypothetical protein